jgi:filamentous hemagglutinin
VRGGTITINGAGLDASKTDYAAILARAVEANAGIWASELKVVTGANTVSADHSQITPTTGNGAAPTFALDVAALGGMYAGKIVLIGTEAGLGVRNAGTIQAAPGATALMGAGQLVVTSAGRLENIGTLQATADANLSASGLANSGRIGSGGNLKIATQGDLANALNGTGGTLEGARLELASAAGDIDNRGGTIRQTSGTGLALSAPALSNTSGGVIGLEPVPETPPTPATGTGGGTDTGTGTGGTTTPTAGTGTGTEGGGTLTPAPYVPPSPGTVTAAGTLRNDGGKIYAGGPISLQSANDQQQRGHAERREHGREPADVRQPRGHAERQQRLQCQCRSIRQHRRHAQRRQPEHHHDRRPGQCRRQADQCGRRHADHRRTGRQHARNVSATGALTANVAGAVNNTGGTLAGQPGLKLSAGSLDNTKGSIQSAQAGVQVAVPTNCRTAPAAPSTRPRTSASRPVRSPTAAACAARTMSVSRSAAQLANDGNITAGRDTTVTAGSVKAGSAGVFGAGIRADGKLGTTGASERDGQRSRRNGRNLAAGNATLQGASVDLSGSQTSAANIAITATQGDVTTGSKAAVVTPGTLSIAANGQATPGIGQRGRATQCRSAGPEALQSRQHRRRRDRAGRHGGDDHRCRRHLEQRRRRIASNGRDLSLGAGGAMTNAAGKHRACGTEGKAPCP